MLAAGLFFERQGIVQYHLSGSRRPALRRQPTKLMMDDMVAWAQARGNRVLHLGGGVGGREDSLFHFKAGLLGLAHPVLHLADRRG